MPTQRREEKRVGRAPQCLGERERETPGPLGPKDAKRREWESALVHGKERERERPLALWLPFSCFSLPQACPM